MSLVIRNVLAPVTVGATCGLLSCIALAEVAQSYVFGVSPADPASS
jgi:hypothetical protein